jgi:hypothetical protein
MKGISRGYNKRIMKEAIGAVDDSNAKEIEKSDIYKQKMNNIKNELKGSMKKSYSSEFSEYVISIDLLSDLLSEFEHTLVDIDKERIQEDNSDRIKGNCKNYIELILSQLRKQNDAQFLDEVARDMMDVLLKESDGDNISEYESRRRKNQFKNS